MADTRLRPGISIPTATARVLSILQEHRKCCIRGTQTDRGLELLAEVIVHALSEQVSA